MARLTRKAVNDTRRLAHKIWYNFKGSSFFPSQTGNGILFGGLVIIFQISPRGLPAAPRPFKKRCCVEPCMRTNGLVPAKEGGRVHGSQGLEGNTILTANVFLASKQTCRNDLKTEKNRVMR